MLTKEENEWFNKAYDLLVKVSKSLENRGFENDLDNPNDLHWITGSMCDLNNVVEYREPKSEIYDGPFQRLSNDNKVNFDMDVCRKCCQKSPDKIIGINSDICINCSEKVGVLA